MMKSVLWWLVLSSLVSICSTKLIIPTVDEPKPIQPPKPDYSEVYVSPLYKKWAWGNCLKGDEVWVFEPLTKKEGGADVVAYIKGYAALPINYIKHIEHLVFQGNYVIFPQYQEGLCLNGKILIGWVDFLFTQSMTAWGNRAAQRVQETLDKIGSSSYKNLYLYTHSQGGLFGFAWESLEVATETRTPVEAAVVSSPAPKGLATAVPEDIIEMFPFIFSEDLDVEKEAQETDFPVVVLHGNEDEPAPMSDIWPSFNALGSSKKVVYQAQGDDHGYPILLADHLMAISLPLPFVPTLSPDTLDWRFQWAALDQVMLGTNITELEFDMGEWSDGKEVLPIVMLEEDDDRQS